MPIQKTQAEIDFLKRIDARLRNCEFQDKIAEAEGIRGGPGGLQSRLRMLGFRTYRNRDGGGWHLVDALMGRSLEDWLNTGELAATPEPIGVAA